MAKSSTKTKVEKTVIEEVKAKTEVKVEQPKTHTIIAKTSVPLRKITSLETKYIVGTLPIGTAYEIVKEVNSKIYGSFYQLNNGYYITKNGNYSIN